MGHPVSWLQPCIRGHSKFWFQPSIMGHPVSLLLTSILVHLVSWFPPSIMGHPVSWLLTSILGHPVSWFPPSIMGHPVCWLQPSIHSKSANQRIHFSFSTFSNNSSFSHMNHDQKIKIFFSILNSKCGWAGSKVFVKIRIVSSQLSNSSQLSIVSSQFSILATF